MTDPAPSVNPKNAEWKAWSSPRQIYLDTNASCNLKCVQCDIHLLKNPVDELSREERKELIRTIGAWDFRIHLHFSGGEPFLRRQEVYDLADVAKDCGLFLGVNTNGTLLKADDYPKLSHSGITTLVFSLDSHLAEVHDAIRGIPGTFDRVIEAIKQTVAANTLAGKPVTILISAILGSHNLGKNERIFALAEQLQVDGVLFQPVQPVFERAIGSDWWETTPLWPQDPAMIREGIAELIRLKAAGARTFHKQKDFLRFGDFFLNKGKLPPGNCVSMQNNLMIDSRGEVRFCFSQDRLNISSLGNIRNTPIQQIWEESRTIREGFKQCDLECGLMLCHGR